ASSRATGTCRPAPPRHTWATTPPWLTGTRPARRSRLISATTSRSPRSTATNAPASSSSTLGGPTLPRAALVGRAWLAPHDHRAAARAAGGLAYLGFGDLAVLGLERGHELIQRAQPPVMRHLQAQRLIHPRTDALRPPLGHCLLSYRHQVGIPRPRHPLLRAHTNMLQLCQHRGHRRTGRGTSASTGQSVITICRRRSISLEGELEDHLGYGKNDPGGRSAARRAGEQADARLAALLTVLPPERSAASPCLSG